MARGRLPTREGRAVAAPRRGRALRERDVALAGTLLLPPGPGPHPACVVAHGSGGQWRDCVRLIADFLASVGVAALAYDKRGTGASTGDWDRASFVDLAEDALAGMRLLQAHPAVDARRVGFFGCSQSGWIVPIAASRAPDAAFAILHSAPAVPVWRQNLNNVEHAMRADGVAEDAIGRAVALMDGVQGLWRTGEGWEELAAASRAAEGEPWLEYVGPLPKRPTPEQARPATTSRRRTGPRNRRSSASRADSLVCPTTSRRWRSGDGRSSTRRTRPNTGHLLLFEMQAPGFSRGC